MSKGAPTAAPKPNFILWLWIGLFIFFGINILTNRPAPDNRSEADIMKAISAQATLVQMTATQQKTTISEAVKELNDSQKINDLLNPNSKLTAEEDLQQMHLLNGLVCDVSVAQVEGQYENQINNDKGLTSAQKDALKIQAQMVVADTLMKAGAERDDMNRVVMASYKIMPYAREYDSQPIWQEPIQVAPTKDYPLTQVSPAVLMDEINTISTNIGKTTKVFGFVPGWPIIDWLVHITGAVPAFSYWFAALILAVFVRGVVFPISQRQMMWSRQMQQLTPLINEIKAEYKGKQDATQEVQKRTMELYKEYGMNPLSGCLPAFIQMPLFYLVYYCMLTYRVQFNGGTFLWINPHTSALSHGFLARSLGEKDYVLIVIYAITMVSSALLQPVSDPSNVRQQRMMGVGMSGLFGIMMFFWPVPSAFILYWTFTNLLATAQSFRAYRLPLPPLEKKNAPNGGVFPSLASSHGPNKEGLPNLPTNGKLNGKPKSTGAPKVHKPKKKK